MFKPSRLVYVKRTRNRGRGVFAAERIDAGDVIEEVPVLVLSVDDIWTRDGAGGLSDYVFEWGPGEVAVALGYGSLYNHSYSPNAQMFDLAVRRKRFVAIRPIRPHEEITINYNGDPANSEPVGFAVE